MPNHSSTSIAELKRAVELAEQIERLEYELRSIFQLMPPATVPIAPSVAPALQPLAVARENGNGALPAQVVSAKKGRAAKVAKAAKVKSAAAASPAKDQKRAFTDEHRAKLVEAAKRRWAAKRGEL